jgi:hypothetical protein
MIFRENTKEFFNQDPEYVVDYLKLRGIENEAYNAFLRSIEFGLLKRMRFIVDDKEFEISHILGKSDIPGYDIVAANENFGLSEGDDVAIALITGDDAICYNTKKGDVCIVYPGEDGRERLLINESLEDFIKRFETKEEKK